MFEKQSSILKALLVFVGVIFPLIGVFLALVIFLDLAPSSPVFCLIAIIKSDLLYIMFYKKPHEFVGDEIQ